MLKSAKDITFIGVYLALLIGGQLALSGFSGVEIVTVLMLCFCYVCGIRKGIIVATVFSLLRCFLFGFYLQVIILYLVYYNIFALFFGWLGSHLKKTTTITSLITVVTSAAIFTILFTLLDDVLTPLLFSFSKDAANAYFWSSLYAVIPQTICAVLSVSILFVPLTKLLNKYFLTKKDAPHPQG